MDYADFDFDEIGRESLPRKQMWEYQVDPNLEMIKNSLFSTSDYCTMTPKYGWPTKSNITSTHSCCQCWTVAN